MPVQEEGTRVARPLPYEFTLTDTVTTNTNTADAAVATVSISLSNSGAGGAPFVLYNLLQLDTVMPRQWALEVSKAVEDTQTISAYDEAAGAGTGGPYSYTLLGANGFVRELRGDVRNSAASTDTTASASCAALSASVSYQPSEGTVTLHLQNGGEGAATFSVVDNAYGLLEAADFVVEAGGSKDIVVNTADSANWYDLTVTAAADAASLAPVSVVTAAAPAVYSAGAECFHRRSMGHMETGANSESDPAMSRGVSGLATSRRAAGRTEDDAGAPAHPLLPERLRSIERLSTQWGALAQFMEGNTATNNEEEGGTKGADNKDGRTYVRATDEF
jgi:phospholipase C